MFMLSSGKLFSTAAILKLHISHCYFSKDSRTCFFMKKVPANLYINMFYKDHKASISGSSATNEELPSTQNRDGAD